MRMGSAGQLLPTDERQKQLGEIQSALVPFVQKLISGEPVDGITPRMAQKFMDIFNPNDLMTMHDRGYQVDPNWYQQYIPSGSVAPNVYNKIMQYSSAFGQEDVDPALRGGFSQWGAEPTYTLPNTLPNWRQSMLQNQYDTMRMGMEGQVYDPHYGDWIYDPGIQWAVLNQAGQNIGMEASPWTTDDPSILQVLRTVFKNALDRGFGSDTTLPIVGQNELDAAVSTIKGYPTSVGGNDLPSSVSMRHFQEASELGLTPREYEGVKNTVTKTILDNPNNPAVWSEVMSMLAQSGLTVQKLDQLRPDWWVQLRGFMTGKTR